VSLFRGTFFFILWSSWSCELYYRFVLAVVLRIKLLMRIVIKRWISVSVCCMFNSAYVGEVESSSSSKKQQPASSEQLETASCAQLVMGACTHCLMYVMLEKSHPKCPRCSSDVLVDFAAAPSSALTPAAAATTTTISSCIKRQRVAQAWRLLNNSCSAVRSLVADPCPGNTQPNLLQTENKAVWSALSSCSCRKNRL
jgi:hypothetical protein